MRNISLFVEDQAHQDFLTVLTQRFAREYNVKINNPISVYSNPAACRPAAGSPAA